ncbi:MAG: tetratricopeptide repeat protein [Steroidobacteraceae bacterium]
MRPTILLLTVSLLAAAAIRAEEGGEAWRDLESRIEYGYYTGDARALARLVPALAADESHDRLHEYYTGLLAWRQALLATPAGSGEKFAARCVASLDAALAAQSDFAEALALRAACRLAPAELGGGYAPLSTFRAHREMGEALRLAPDNPRVLLLDALSDYRLSASQGGNRERALVELRRATAAFESERRAADHVPGWGAPDAYLLLGRDLLDHGDPAGARDALERALLLAPDCAQVRRLLARITAG